jgi:uncharacterized protein
LTRIAVALALAVAAAPARAQAPIPPLTGPVVDAARMLDPRSVRAMEELSRAARAANGGNGVQLQYLTIASLEGEAIESYSMRVAEAWKIGSKGQDNGVLVVVARDDRAVRIEVGGGVEGGLTDLQSGRIIRGTIVPAFRAGEFGRGLYDAGVQILSALGALPQDGPVRVVRRRPQGTLGLSTIVIGLFVLMFVLRMLGGLGPRRAFGRRRRGPFFFGGPFGGFGGPFGGGGGWGGGGGGGWGGGGGGFSGGGASGRW